MSDKNNGQFKPGQSGNPGGRPRGYGEIRELARQHTDKAIEVLVQIMDDDKAPPTARASAAQALLDRGWGRPESTTHVISETRETFVDVLKRLNEGQQEQTH